MKTYCALRRLLRGEQGFSAIVSAFLLMLAVLAYLTVLTAIGQRSALSDEPPIESCAGVESHVR